MGDTVTTHAKLEAPEWLPLDGKTCSAEAYPELAKLMPKALEKVEDAAPVGKA